MPSIIYRPPPQSRVTPPDYTVHATRKSNSPYQGWAVRAAAIGLAVLTGAGIAGYMFIPRGSATTKPQNVASYSCTPVVLDNGAIRHKLVLARENGEKEERDVLYWSDKDCKEEGEAERTASSLNSLNRH